MFENFKYLPQSTKRLYFGIFTVVVVGILLFGLVWLNTRNKNTPVQNQDQTVQENLETLQSANIVPYEVFNNRSLFSPVGTQEVNLDTDLVLNGNDVFFLSSNNKLVRNGVEIIASPIFDTNTTLQESQDYIILHSPNGVTIYDIENQTFRQFEEILGLTYDLVKSKWVFLLANGPALQVYQVENISSILNKRYQREGSLLGVLIPAIEIKNIRMDIVYNLPTISISNNTNFSGQIEIWTVDQSPTRVNTLNNVQDVLYGQNRLVYTSLDKSQIFQTPDFTSSQILETDITSKLPENNTLGEISLKRCSIKFTDTLLCAVKRDKVSTEAFALVDDLVEINLENSEITKTYTDLEISASRIFTPNIDSTYLIDQSQPRIYRIL